MAATPPALRAPYGTLEMVVPPMSGALIFGVRPAVYRLMSAEQKEAARAEWAAKLGRDPHVVAKAKVRS